MPSQLRTAAAVRARESHGAIEKHCAPRQNKSSGHAAWRRHGWTGSQQQQLVKLEYFAADEAAEIVNASQ